MGAPNPNAETVASQAESSTPNKAAVGMRELLGDLMVEAVDWSDQHRRALVFGSLLGICSKCIGSRTWLAGWRCGLSIYGGFHGRHNEVETDQRGKLPTQLPAAGTCTD
jgi:hypothetical protein